MNNDKKMDILIESFETFKDDWENSSETLVKTIEKICKIDDSTALKMWTYLLNNNTESIYDECNLVNILGYFPQKTNEVIVKDTYLMDCVFCKSGNTWHNSEFIAYFFNRGDLSTAGYLLGLVESNKNEIAYIYGECNSSQLSSMLEVLEIYINLSNSESKEFINNWIERVEDKKERLKLSIRYMEKDDD